MKFSEDHEFARKLDREDPLKKFRKEFLFPKIHGKAALYFTGNSLGLQPRNAKAILNQELTDWGSLGVEGHFHAARPWLHYHKFSQRALARIAGAKPSEVVAMNQLTVNLHLLMTAFYRPTAERFKIISEAGAFSSDQYAIESHLALHGYTPEEALIEVSPRPGEFTLRTQDILDVIHANAPQTALVIFGGVQYYSGQFFNIKAITLAAHRAGSVAGFDLAHAMGNVPLHLHRDGPDFAVWCGYKYLNSGPGGIAGAFIHERHAHRTLPRLAGWWGHDDKVRFKMQKGFRPMAGAAGWQLSNFPVFSGAVQLAALEHFDNAGMTALRRKSTMLTSYLEYLLLSIGSPEFEIITPKNPAERGCQLSILMRSQGKRVFRALEKAGIVADWREPNVIRAAPVPLYNSFEDVYEFARIFKRALKK